MRTFWPVLNTDPPRVTIYRNSPQAEGHPALCLGRHLTIAQAVETATAELRRHGVTGPVLDVTMFNVQGVQLFNSRWFEH